ncbi:Tim44-like domain containing protein [Candidatus Kinetoplastibacterium oncopeltii TCC290E]|uniref:Tim44-like domain containing protein n=1 Tax=Candidatus Kinetoplastidibacterium stringomonadis TCC290E TaxID=1208920 RepID=M1M7S4_9PROT|nr:Tim44-like domain-containing protein [Candidatus Kinetoplastibacterium oncopeltii]AGF48090.1 Tim44-like domain containing protein [Candidatus Kinetoplastibacterium oncopeltii TCC290E]
MFISLKSKFFLLSLIFVIFTAMFLSCNAEARRIGGGHNIGKHYKAPYKKNDLSSNNHYKKESKTTINHSNKGNLFSKIMGPIIAGFGLATMLSYFGLSGFFVNFISISIIIFLILSSMYLIFSYFFMKNSKISYCGKQKNFQNNNDGYFINKLEKNSSFCDNFNTKEFSEQAKIFFLHMQESWRNGDIDSLKIYLTDEMISIIENDFKHKNYDREVQVLSLYYEFLNTEYEKSNDNTFANIRFFGVIKENTNSNVNSFDEIWIFQKNHSSGWLLAGIQENIDH